MEREPMEKFDKAFRAWARRPPVTPAAAAAGQVLERLAERAQAPARSHRAWRWANALAAVLLAVVITARFAPVLDPNEAAMRASITTSLEVPPLPEGVVLMWLDAETPLYFTMEKPKVPHGEPTS